jgi:hypothetical protein
MEKILAIGLFLTAILSIVLAFGGFNLYVV